LSATIFEYYETLGEGVAGVVYRAKDPKGREVAVKLLREAAAKDEDLLRRFRREVDIATALEHENLVTAFEGGRTAAGRLYLSSEFIDGGNAARLLEFNRPLAEAAALSVARDVLRALAYLHAQKLVHRDVKPENVLVRADGVAKLSDFGLARSAAPGGARLTSTGEVLGTPYYIAPEQIQGKKDVDIRADLYSVGCMLAEWLLGKRPYEGATVVDILAGHLKGAIPDLAAARPDLNAGTIAVVKELLTKDREARPKDPATMENCCAEVLTALGAGDGRAAVREALAKCPARTGVEAKPSSSQGQQTLTSADALAAQGRSPRFRLKLTGSRSSLVLYVFSGSVLQLGRDAVDKSANDVCLRVRGPGGDVGSKKISSKHLKVELDARGALVKDLETQNGTKISGMRLQPKQPFVVRSSARVDVAGALDLELRVQASETSGAPPAAVVLLRPANGSDQAYALVREKVVLGESQGAPVAGAHAGSILAVANGGFTLNGQPIAAGKTVDASGLKIEVAEIRPEDMK
jgi:serine/threonine protein kinase